MNDEDDLIEAKVTKAGKSLGEYLLLIKKIDKKSVLKHIEHLYDLRDSSFSNESEDYLRKCDDGMIFLLSRMFLAKNLFEMRRGEAALTYFSFLCTTRNIKEDAALKYVIELINLNAAAELHDKATNDNNISVKDNKTDYPPPPPKGDYVPPSRKEKSSDDPEVLYHSKLSSDINRARILRRKQREEMIKNPLSNDSLKALDKNLNNQIDSLYKEMIFAESSYEMDIIADSIETIIQKKKTASNLFAMPIESTESD